MSSEAKKEWVSAVEAGRILGCPARKIPQFAKDGLVTVRRLPGCDPRYLLADVERLASQSTEPATCLTSLAQTSDVFEGAYDADS